MTFIALPPFQMSSYPPTQMPISPSDFNPHGCATKLGFQLPVPRRVTIPHGSLDIPDSVQHCDTYEGLEWCRGYWTSYGLTAVWQWTCGVCDGSERMKKALKFHGGPFLGVWGVTGFICKVLKPISLLLWMPLALFLCISSLLPFAKSLKFVTDFGKCLQHTVCVDLVEKDMYGVAVCGGGKPYTRFHVAFSDIKLLCSNDTSDPSRKQCRSRVHLHSLVPELPEGRSPAQHEVWQDGVQLMVRLCRYSMVSISKEWR